MRTKVARYWIQVVIWMATIGGAGAAAADKPASAVVGIHIENPTLVPESMLGTQKDTLRVFTVESACRSSGWTEFLQMRRLGSRTWNSAL